MVLPDTLILSRTPLLPWGRSNPNGFLIPLTPCFSAVQRRFRANQPLQRLPYDSCQPRAGRLVNDGLERVPAPRAPQGKKTSTGRPVRSRPKVYPLPVRWDEGPAPPSTIPLRRRVVTDTASLTQGPQSAAFTPLLRGSSSAQDQNPKPRELSPLKRRKRRAPPGPSHSPTFPLSPDPRTTGLPFPPWTLF